MRRSVAWAVLIALACAANADARAPKAARPRPEPTAPAYVPSPIAIGRVRIDVRGAKMLVTTDLTIPEARGQLSDMDVHVAYGSPGTPLAFDAQVMPTPAGYQVAPVDSSGQMLAHEWAPRASSWAVVQVGRPLMGGQTVHLTADALAAAQARTGRATLRIREVYAAPAVLSDDSREVVVRLASSGGKPLALGLIEFASDVAAPRVEARTCGLDGEGASLFVAGARSGRDAVAPPLADRGEHDDLCVRFGAKVSASD